MLFQERRAMSFVTTLFAAHVLSSSLTEPASAPSHDMVAANKTGIDQISIPSPIFGKVEPIENFDETSVQDCTLKALRILLSNRADKLTNECRDILSLWTKSSSGKQGHADLPEQAILRRELNDLVKKKKNYESLAEEIQNVQNILAEKRFIAAENSDISETDTLPELHSMNDDELFNINADNIEAIEGIPLISGNKNAMDVAYNSNRNQKHGMLDRFRQGVWNNDFIDETDLDLPAGEELRDNEDIADDDFLVIPLRFLRKNNLLGPRRIGTERLQNSRASIPKMSSVTENLDHDNRMTKWLLQSLLSSETKETPTEGYTLTGKGKMDGKSKSTTDSVNDEELSISRKTFQDWGKSTINVIDGSDQIGDAERIIEFDRTILSQVENDIQKLWKDLLKLQLERSH